MNKENEVYKVHVRELDCEGRYTIKIKDFIFDDYGLAKACYKDLSKDRFAVVSEPEIIIVNKDWR